MKYLTLMLIMTTAVLTVADSETGSEVPAGANATAGTGAKGSQNPENSKKNQHSLGFPSASETLISVGEDKICGPEITEIAVTVETLKTKFAQMAKSYRRKVAGKGKSIAKGISNELGEDEIDALKATTKPDAANPEKPVASDQFEHKLSDPLLARKNRFLGDDMLEKDDREKLADKIEDVTKTLPKCVETFIKIKAGFICKALSSTADKSVKLTGDKKMEVTANTEDATKLFDNCTSFFWAQCMEITVRDTFEESNTGDIKTEHPGKVLLRAFCNDIVADTNCKNEDDNKCSQSVKDHAARVFLNLGSEKNSLYDSEREKQDEADFKNNKGVRPKPDGAKTPSADTGAETKPSPAQNRILIARFLEDADIEAEVTVVISSTAESLYSIGNSSGFDIATLSKGTSILVTALVSSLVALIA